LYQYGVVFFQNEGSWLNKTESWPPYFEKAVCRGVILEKRFQIECPTMITEVVIIEESFKESISFIIPKIQISKSSILIGRRTTNLAILYCPPVLSFWLGGAGFHCTL